MRCHAQCGCRLGSRPGCCPGYRYRRLSDSAADACRDAGRCCTQRQRGGCGRCDLVDKSLHHGAHLGAVCVPPPVCRASEGARCTFPGLAQVAMCRSAHMASCAVGADAVLGPGVAGRVPIGRRDAGLERSATRRSSLPARPWPGSWLQRLGALPARQQQPERCCTAAVRSGLPLPAKTVHPGWPPPGQAGWQASWWRFQRPACRARTPCATALRRASDGQQTIRTGVGSQLRWGRKRNGGSLVSKFQSRT